MLLWFIGSCNRRASYSLFAYLMVVGVCIFIFGDQCEGELHCSRTILKNNCYITPVNMDRLTVGKSFGTVSLFAAFDISSHGS